MKRVVSTILSIALLVSMSINAFAASPADTATANNNLQSSSKLTDLWLEGRDTFKLVDATSDNRKLISQITVNDVLYQIEENVNEDASVVESNFYKFGDLGKIYIGQQKTFIVQDEDSIVVSVEENGKIIDVQSFNNSTSIDTSANQDSEITEDTLQIMASIEAKWFSQGKANGSNNIYRYTAAAIVAVLSTAAGNAAAAGLAAVASMIIAEQWPAVYWTRETWVYMERCSDWPSYPDWVQAGKYKYYTEYYSDRNRTNLIGTSSYTDGE